MEELVQAFLPATVVPVDMNDSERIEKELRTAEVAVLNGDLDLRYVHAPYMKWIHCDHSGLNNSALPEVFEKGIIVTGSAGRSFPVLAEHALYFALSLTYNAPVLHEAKKTHLWDSVCGYKDRRGMFSKTMGIIGMGHTGIELAKRAKAFGMSVLGYSRSATQRYEYLDTYYSADAGDSVDDLIMKSDYIVLTCRLSDETYHLIGSREFSMMKNSAYLINIARGPVVDETALQEALIRHEIAGAGSDVFEEEPLPSESPLWDIPNMLITPHCTPEVPDLQASSLEIIKENIYRYRKGMPLLNALKERDVYYHASRS